MADITDLRFEYQAALGRYDLVLQTGTVDLTMATATDVIDQKILAVLRMEKGDWYLDTRQGVPYFADLLEKGVSAQAVGSAISAALLRIPEVLAVTEMQVALDSATRQATISFVARTTDGTIPVQEVI